MAAFLKDIIANFPQLQIVLNYAPRHEEEEARVIADELRSPSVFLNVNANSIRKLMAMVSCCSFYFGNEGGTRHIAEALGKPTFCICAPTVSPKTWISNSDGRHETVSPGEFATKERLAQLTNDEQYDLISPEIVSSRLMKFIETYLQIVRK